MTMAVETLRYSLMAVICVAIIWLTLSAGQSPASGSSLIIQQGDLCLHSSGLKKENE